MTADFDLASVESKKSLIYTRLFDSHILRAQQRQQKGGPSLEFRGFLIFSANGVSRATKSWNLCVFDGGFIEINCQFAFSRKFSGSRPRNFSRPANPRLSYFRAIVSRTLCCCDRQQFCFRLISGCRPLMFQLFRDFHSYSIGCDFYAIVGRKKLV